MKNGDNYRFKGEEGENSSIFLDNNNDKKKQFWPLTG